MTAPKHWSSWSEEPADLPAPRNGVAVAALACGAASIPAVYLLGVVDVVLGLLGLVLGFLALRQVRRGLASRRGFAIAGMVTGAVGIVLVIVAVIASTHVYNDCKHKIGHAPSTAELKQCTGH